MDCPFCGKEMKEGTIPSGSRWIPDDGLDAGEEVPLAVGLLGTVPKSFYCPDCRQIILPVPEKAGFWEAVQQKIDAASEKLNAARGQWEARCGEERERRQKKEFGSKDPWEL